MLTLNIGSIPLAVPHLLIIGSLLIAVLTGAWLGRGSTHNIDRILFNCLVAALLIARLAFVARYFKHYQNDLWRVVDIRDGGYIAWPGILVALTIVTVQLWRRPGLRKPLGISLIVGLLSWGLGNLAWQSMERSTRLPELTLYSLEGRPIQLTNLQGKPLVINLWASWCPPCRREMPVLASAQSLYPDTQFVFVNQGEAEETIQEYLAKAQIDLHTVLLDPSGLIGKQVGSQALPTTLFYDAQGRQVGSHLGELSQASLAQALNQPSMETTP
ncbi:TlpA family protein disulfide reductase (plasmid) [Pseudomonas luteola]|uniref:redoxin family protein n=1 Tax=Pseudomonas luteola TaxID=47886 RepID=UPI00388E14E6